ncbi:ABC transporter permease [Gordonia sp. TBRC 11910]|uniref:ABC transporter permease n=1 Tax=Gordonia asplenii TaxID=2725283 RepID=A0A848KN23_9ACTN|nr:ABC transporter permease [Gordonia asplenii]NMO00076.1 ABC transporter permease [Gordonia asplenii]
MTDIDRSAHELDGPALNAPRETSIKAWVTQSLPLTGRQLLVWFRDPVTMTQSLLMPALSMILFKILLGSSIAATTGQNSAYGTVPLVILVGAMFGSTAAAVRLNQERSSGLLGRLYVMPINRGADITSRISAELVRILLTTLVLLAAGHLIGFRFTQGPIAAIALVGVALLYGAAFSMLVLALAVSAKPGAPLVPYIGLLSSLMMFFNSGFVPVDMYPDWLQPIVRYQPMSPAIEVMRALSMGGPVTKNLIIVVCWAVAILALTTYPALRGYRKAATDR